jgi:DNA-binding NtrC family response regulator
MSAPSVRHTILVVDDEPMLRDVVSAVLTQAGYHVLTADRAAAARELLRQHADEIALVLLDLTLPGNRGAHIFDELSTEKPDVRIVACSGHDLADVAPALADRPQLAAFLQKPFTPVELTDLVSRMMRGDPRGAAARR